MGNDTVSILLDVLFVKKEKHRPINVELSFAKTQALMHYKLKHLKYVMLHLSIFPVLYARVQILNSGRNFLYLTLFVHFGSRVISFIFIVYS